ncbi:MAG: hypothetical protein AAB355_02865 [Patescibacteria group bacterium]
MNYLLKILESLVTQLKSIIVTKNLQTEASKKLYEVAKTFLDKDASPKDLATDEYGCAESLNAVCEAAWGEPIGGGVSTYRMYYALLNHKKFVEVTSPLAGDIILSPTGIGGGKNGIKNGHTGIVSSNGKIMSNNSDNGLWQEKYDLWSWRYRYVQLGEYKMLYYRRIF